MKKYVLISLALLAVIMAFADTKTVLFDGRNLTAATTTKDSAITQDDIDYIVSKGAKTYAKTTGSIDFADVTKCILIGQKGAYIYNQTPFGAGITKFEIYTNRSGSAKVTSEISFSETLIKESSDDKIDIEAPTPDAIKEIENIPENAKYFFWKITNSNNAQIAFRITYEESESTPTAVDNVSKNEANSVKKILESGQLLILHDGKKYNLNGQIVE